jgi:DNA polymerase III subunit delta
MEALDFLESQSKDLSPVFAVHGDEDFLRRQVIQSIRRRVFGSEADEFGLSTYAGESAQWPEVLAELETRPFFGPLRLLVIDNADPFVTLARPLLEKYVAHPAPTGILVLDLKSFPATTRLAKSLPSTASIVCKALVPARAIDWCRRWATQRFAQTVSLAAARILVDLVGPELGLLDQELAKLSTYVGPGQPIGEQEVDLLVGNSSEANTFKVFDAIAAGDIKAAMQVIDRVLTQGDEPLRVLGAFTYQLRNLVHIVRLTQQGHRIREAFDTLGVPPYGRARLEQLARHLGKKRIDRLYEWLIETDQALKSSSQLPARVLLERLVARLAQPAASNARARSLSG